MESNIKKISVVSLVHGILSCALAIIEFNLILIILGMFVSLLGLILSIFICTREKHNKMNVAAIVLNAAGLFASFIWLYLYLI